MISRHNFLVRVLLVAAVAGAVALASLAAYGAVWGFDNPTAHAVRAADTSTSQPTTTTAAPTTTTAIPATTTTHPKMGIPPVQQMPAVPTYGFSQGARGDSIRAYEQRLRNLHFDPGAIDGYFDQSLRYSVEAVQKLYGLPRTGRIDEGVRTALTSFRYPKPLVKHAEGTRVEIDLDRQVLIVWHDYRIRLITTTSTGSGRYFCGGDEGCQFAVTPAGRFEFQWHYNGWRHGKLGTLWNPYYFNGGIAVHGYSSVPTYNASHGCTRIPMHIANYFATLVHAHEPVYVVGTPAAHIGGPPPGGWPTTTAPPTTTTVPGTTTPTTKPKPTTTTAPATTTTVPPTTTT